MASLVCKMPAGSAMATVDILGGVAEGDLLLEPLGEITSENGWPSCVLIKEKGLSFRL